MRVFTVISDAGVGSATLNVTSWGFVVLMQIHMQIQISFLCKFMITDFTLKSFETEMVCLNMPFEAVLRRKRFTARANEVLMSAFVELKFENLFNFIFNNLVYHNFTIFIWIFKTIWFLILEFHFSLRNKFFREQKCFESLLLDNGKCFNSFLVLEIKVHFQCWQHNFCLLLIFNVFERKPGIKTVVKLHGLIWYLYDELIF